MTVKEYLEVHSGEDIQSVGIYDACCDSGHDIINTHVDAVEVVKYLDREIDHVSLGIFDETRKTINGDNYNAKFIRACIYVK